jgi:predicted deacylase
MPAQDLKNTYNAIYAETRHHEAEAQSAYFVGNLHADEITGVVVGERQIIQILGMELDEV